MDCIQNYPYYLANSYFSTTVLLYGLPCWFSGKESLCQCKRSRFNPWVGKEMATCSSSLAWEISWTEETGRLQSMGLQRDVTEQLNSMFLHNFKISFMLFIIYPSYMFPILLTVILKWWAGILFSLFKMKK